MVAIAGVLALVVTVVFVLALRPVALEIGLADEPGGRKKHASRVPLIGGVAMALGLAFGSSLVSEPEFWGAAALGIWLLVAVGVIDDRFELPPAVRLLTQAIAAMLVVFGADLVAWELGEPVFFPVSTGPFGPPFTVLLIMTVVNGFNLIDGIDGLAGGVALVSLAAAFAGCGLAGHWAGAPDGLMLAGWLAGGLFYNRITWRPEPIALWVRGWKASRSGAAARPEPAPAGSGSHTAD